MMEEKKNYVFFSFHHRKNNIFEKKKINKIKK